MVSDISVQDDGLNEKEYKLKTKNLKLRKVDIQNPGYNQQIGKLTTKREHFFPVDFSSQSDISKVESSGYISKFSAFRNYNMSSIQSIQFTTFFDNKSPIYGKQSITNIEAVLGKEQLGEITVYFDKNQVSSLHFRNHMDQLIGAIGKVRFTED